MTVDIDKVVTTAKRHRTEFNTDTGVSNFWLPIFMDDHIDLIAALEQMKDVSEDKLEAVHNDGYRKGVAAASLRLTKAQAELEQSQRRVKELEGDKCRGCGARPRWNDGVCITCESNLI